MKTAGLALVRNGANGWFSFSRPVREYVAHTPEHVLKVLRKVDSAAKRGSHCVGYVSYEAAPAFDPSLRTHKAEIPCAWFREYAKRESLDDLPQPSGTHSLEFDRAGMGRAHYVRAIKRIKNLLKAGATYQVNFTFPLHFRFAGDPFDLFCQLHRNQDSDHSVYIDTGSFVISSVSPELFFTQHGNRVETRPMKGTSPRMPDFDSDMRAEKELLRSGKNAAENVMIVDMIRNDLGRICEPGSVKVGKLFEVERYPTVFQATSSVSGNSDAALPELFRALFPCASVTGAPKVETMKIIRMLEPVARGIYTGAIGFVAKDRISFNVGIRTLLIEQTGRAVYGVGSGVVWESDADDEYDECLAKAKVLEEKSRDFQLLETMLWRRRCGFALLDEHLARMRRSAEYFGFAFQPTQIRQRLERGAGKYGDRMRVRLLLSKNGKCQIEAVTIPESSSSLWRVGISRVRAKSSDRFLYHKTTNRSFYESALSDHTELDDVLLFNERGELTESCKANVVVVLKGDHYTPPVSAGLLAGTYRQSLLSAGKISERVLRMKDLRAADEVYLVNSVRGKIPIVLENLAASVA